MCTPSMYNMTAADSSSWTLPGPISHLTELEFIFTSLNFTYKKVTKATFRANL